MAGLLKIIATPIGNLSDLSLRATEALKSCSVIFAENTLHSRKLLSHLEIDLSKTHLISCAAPQEKRRIPILLKYLEENQIVGFISDAGSPGINDPGNQLIQAALQAEHAIEVIPGPCAVITALMGAGLISHRFAFLGFLPKKGGEKTRLVQEAYQMGLALVLFESPYRIQKTLDHLYHLLGPQKIVVARELTKRFETFHRGILGQELKPKLIEKGEFVIILDPPGRSQQHFE